MYHEHEILSPHLILRYVNFTHIVYWLLLHSLMLAWKWPTYVVVWFGK
jgi:hypothetical protein